MRAIDPGALETPVMTALRQAAQKTDTDFDFLLRTAARESNFDPSVKAKTSSAAGMFQFIEQTWFSMLARHGGKYGLKTEAAALHQTASGRWDVADPAMRSRILEMRHDPQISAYLAGELAQESTTTMERDLGRKITSGELYAAHFLGARGAARLIDAAEASPQASAAAMFPQEAAANKPIFYDEAGQSRSLSDVYQRLTAERPVAGQPAATDPRPSSPVDEMAVALYSSGAVWPTSSRPDTLVLSPGVFDVLAAIDPVDIMTGSSAYDEPRKRERG